MKNSIRERIETRLNELDKMMREGVHLSDRLSVEEKIESVSKFWSYLSDEDRDYLNAVRHALSAKKSMDISSFLTNRQMRVQFDGPWQTKNRPPIKVCPLCKGVY